MVLSWIVGPSGGRRLPLKRLLQTFGTVAREQTATWQIALTIIALADWTMAEEGDCLSTLDYIRNHGSLNPLTAREAVDLNIFC